MTPSHCKKHLFSDSKAAPVSLELWGGIECTVVRMHDDFRNQIIETGHAERIDDLDAIAALGIKTLRYPVLWETISPDHPEVCNWDWHDARLGRLRELGIAPIAGLVHHGSGPLYTNLHDPAFPELLARHAERVATRYPWITMFTPVNEPLTTARFSGLYGHWYPHQKSCEAMLLALYTQCRAVVLCMRAIRSVTSGARLIQTEDLGKVFSTPRLQVQADYENERRWLSLDLLCGKVDAAHPWYPAFLNAKITPDEMNFFLEENCAPDMIGINHYLTSERFLDHRLSRLPAFLKDADTMLPYGDMQAVRVDMQADQLGPRPRLREAWQRYGLPIAITEAHFGGSRDEQLRWLMEMWNAARDLKAEGVDMRAVTVWSIFGCVDWNTLLLEKRGFYETGVFDVRSSPPRPTALAVATTALAATGKFEHPVINQPGWWKRDDRFFYRPSRHKNSGGENIFGARSSRIAIAGAGGTLGQAFSRICGLRGLEHELLTRADMDIADGAAVEARLMRSRPWALVNTAGYVRTSEASRNVQRCFRENAAGAEVLAQACARLGIIYVTFSSDLVFDGQLGRSYVESDAVSPLCTYGISKAAAERQVMAANPEALVIRTSAFFGPWDRYNFVHAVLRDLALGQPVNASDEVLVSPTYVPDLVHATLDLLIDKAVGVWHLTNQGVTSWHELAVRVAQQAGLDSSGLVKTRGGNGKRLTALSSERGLILPSLDSALERFVNENAVDWQASR